MSVEKEPRKGPALCPFMELNLSDLRGAQKGPSGQVYPWHRPLGRSPRTGPPRTSGGAILGSGDPLGERRALGSPSQCLQPVGELRRVVPATLLVACGSEGTCEASPGETTAPPLPVQELPSAWVGGRPSAPRPPAALTRLHVQLRHLHFRTAGSTARHFRGGRTPERVGAAPWPAGCQEPSTLNGCSEMPGATVGTGPSSLRNSKSPANKTSGP